MPRKYALLTRLFLLLFFIFNSPSFSRAESIYTVKQGDSLYTIAKKFKVKIAQLQEINRLPNSKIKPGQRLIIPELLGSNQAAAKEKKREKLKVAQVLYLQKPSLPEEDRPGEEAPKEIKRVNGLGFLITEKDRELLVRVAKSFLGLRYTRGGTSINGMDCSAFVQRVFKVFGIELPRTTREQYQVGYAIPRNSLRRGDLVFFKRGSSRQPAHVGIYIGNNQFIHTSLKKGRVEVDNLENGYFSSLFLGARRIEEDIEKQGENTFVHVHLGNSWE
ncbi:MAG: NlpC/P60 family protein [bacterium]